LDNDRGGILADAEDFSDYDGDLEERDDDSSIGADGVFARASKIVGEDKLDFSVAVDAFFAHFQEKISFHVL
jgi:hypothetical protein